MLKIMFAKARTPKFLETPQQSHFLALWIRTVLTIAVTVDVLTGPSTSSIHGWLPYLAVILAASCVVHWRVRHSDWFQKSMTTKILVCFDLVAVALVYLGHGPASSDFIFFFAFYLIAACFVEDDGTASYFLPLVCSIVSLTLFAHTLSYAAASPALFVLDRLLRDFVPRWLFLGFMMLLVLHSIRSLRARLNDLLLERGRFLEVVEELPDAAIVINRDGNVECINERAKEMFPSADRVAVGDPMQNFVDCMSQSNEFFPDGEQSSRRLREWHDRGMLKSELSEDIASFVRWRRNGDKVLVNTIPLYRGGYLRSYQDVTKFTDAEQLIENSPIAVSIIPVMSDLSERKYVNEAFKTMFADERTDAVVQRSYAFSKDWEGIKTSLKKGQLLLDALVLRRKANGETFWCSMTAQRTNFESEDCYIVWHIDVSARIEAAKKLEEEELRLRDWLDCSADWFWETDVEGKFTYFSKNEAAEEILGREYCKFVGTDRFKYLDKRSEDVNSEKWQAHKTALREHGSIKKFRYNYRHPAGRPVRIEINAVPFFDDDGRFSGYRGTGSDVTFRQKVDFLRATLFGLIGHDLNSPLGIITKKANETLAELDLDLSPIQKPVNDIIFATQTLCSHVKTVSELAELFKADLELAIVRLDAEAIIKEVIETNNSFALAHNKRIKFYSDDHASHEVLTDVTLFRGLIRNLFTNACRHSTGQTVDVAIGEYAANGHKFCKIQVIDQSPNPDRLDIDEKKGLSIVREISLLTGSVAQRDHERKNGVTWTILVPQSHSEELLDIDCDHTNIVESRVIDLTGVETSRGSVLVTHENSGIRHGCRAVLFFQSSPLALLESMKSDGWRVSYSPLDGFVSNPTFSDSIAHADLFVVDVSDERSARELLDSLSRWTEIKDVPRLLLSGRRKPLAITARNLEQAYWTEQESTVRIPNDIRAVLSNFSRPTQQSPGHEILLIEDIYLHQTIIQGALFRAGYSLQVADNAARGLALARALSPSLIIVDFMLGSQSYNGADVVRRLRFHRATENIPVMALSAEVNDKMRHDLESAGCEHIFDKTSSSKEIIEHIDQTLGVRR